MFKDFYPLINIELFSILEFSLDIDEKRGSHELELEVNPFHLGEGT
jgi:hypothetical protein